MAVLVSEWRWTGDPPRSLCFCLHATFILLPPPSPVTSTQLTPGVAGLAALTSLLGKSAAALIWSTLLGILTTILSLGAVILNATLWPPLRRDALSSGATSASYGSPIRFVIASLALSALAPIIAGIEACAGCIKRRHERGKYVPVGEQGGKRGSTYRQSAYELPLHVDLSRPVDPIRPVDLTGSADLGRSADVARPAETAK